MTVAKFRTNKPMTSVEGMRVFNTDQVDTTKGQMFSGAPLGVQRYDKFKYPIFDKLTPVSYTHLTLPTICSV